MRVNFVSGGFENLGIEYLSAVLEQHGFETKLALDPQLFNDPFLRITTLGKLFNYQKVVLNEIEQFNPEIIAFSVVSADYSWAVDLAQKIKSFSNAHITFGGIHPSSVPEKVLAHNCVDSVVLGEAEYALLDLANSIKSGKVDKSIQNIWFKDNNTIIKNSIRPYISDLDTIPFPNKELYYKEIPEYTRGYTIITRRGCIKSCSFCHHSFVDALYSEEPKRMRLRSVENVLDELKIAKKKYNFKFLRINDEIFTYNKDWLRKFVQLYETEIDVPIYCFASPGTIDEEIITLLKRAKCYQICMGVQSPNPKVRKEIFKRSESNDKVIQAIQLCRKHKIRLVIDNIIGYPGETENNLLQMAEFYNKHRPHRICVFWLVYYPRTFITQIAKNMGILNDEDIEKLENEPFDTANTLFNNAHTKIKKRYHLFLVLFNILPAKLFNFMLIKKWYKYLPTINPALIEYPYTIFAKDRLDIPRRRYYVRYLKYLPKVIFQKRNKYKK